MHVPLHAEHVIQFTSEKKKSIHKMGTSVAIMIKITRQMTIIVGHISELFPMLPAKPKNIIKQLELNFLHHLEVEVPSLMWPKCGQWG